MHPSDLDPFTQLLDATCALLSRGKYEPDATETALFFRALAPHTLAEVRAAFDAHVRDPQRGRFPPLPADILAQLEGLAANDGRPGADEAWATVMAAQDQQATVVWTEEMAEAAGIVAPILRAGDEVGARVAFREAYNRLVEVARTRRRPARWQAALGHDKQAAELALRAAVARGLLKASQLQDTPALPAPDASGVLALPAPGAATVTGLGQLLAMAPQDWRARLRQQRDEIAAGPSRPSAAEQRTAADRARTAQLKAEAEALAIPHLLAST